MKDTQTKKVNCRICDTSMFIFESQDLDCALCDSCLCDICEKRGE